MKKRLNHIADLLKSDRDSVESRLELLIDRSRKLEKEIEQLKSKLASSAGSEMLANSIDINGVKSIGDFPGGC